MKGRKDDIQEAKMDARTRPVKAWRKICRAGAILVTSILALAIWLLAIYSLNFV